MARILHRNTAIYMTLAFGALFGALLLHWGPRARDTHQRSIRVANAIIPVTIADTEALRMQGLSGTASLEKGTGMFFVFDRPGTYGFWMKDMHYPLDIVWIDDAAQVIGIAADISPATYPEVLNPPAPVRYVLEMNADDAQKEGMFIGAHVQFNR